MVVLAIIGVLAAIAVPQFNNFATKAAEASTKGNLSTLRSALAIYYSDNSNPIYPNDDLTSLMLNMKYLPAIPFIKTTPFHDPTQSVTMEPTPSDSGRWSYDNGPLDDRWGIIAPGCLHKDSRAQIWSSY